MNLFSQLYRNLDSTTKTSDKVSYLSTYFNEAPPEDAAWALSFLSGNRLKKMVNSRLLQTWASEAAGIPPWLFTQCYDAVGDLAETVSLILPATTPNNSPIREVIPLHQWIIEFVLPLQTLLESDQRRLVETAWARLNPSEIFLFNKFITGGFRVGMSQDLVLRALSLSVQLPATLLSQRMMGGFIPSGEEFLRLTNREATSDEVTLQPFPFCLAHPYKPELSIESLEKNSEILGALSENFGDVSNWLIEKKWDGIRAQVVVRNGQISIWSRGEEIITDRFPEIVNTLRANLNRANLKSLVIDGEILAWNEGYPLPFSQLQQRIGRKNLTTQILQSIPVKFLAFDLLEIDSIDMRDRRLFERREHLDHLLRLFESSAIIISPVIAASNWEDVVNARKASGVEKVEGLMLKRRDSTYQGGRKRGVWWKWKVDPMTVDAVMIYAQRGSGRRASLYSDYTFALKSGEDFVPIAKAYSGLTDAEMKEVDAWIRKNTIEKFGPVRSVPPFLVMELAFEGIQISSRHKSGIAVRFPRIVRIRTDKTVKDVDQLEEVKALLMGSS